MPLQELLTWSAKRAQSPIVALACSTAFSNAFRSFRCSGDDNQWQCRCVFTIESMWNLWFKNDLRGRLQMLPIKFLHTVLIGHSRTDMGGELLPQFYGWWIQLSNTQRIWHGVAKTQISEKKSKTRHHCASPSADGCDIEKNHTNFASRIRLYPL